MKNFKMFLFWFLQCTWGLIMTLAGVVGAIVMLCKGVKPKRFGYSVYFVYGHHWGGVCLGGFFFVSQESNVLATKAHESRHAIQNIIFGPLFPFVVGAPSIIRYHLFNHYTLKTKEHFALILILVAGGIGLIVSIIGILLSSTFVSIVGIILCLYTIIITLWLCFSELPKMADDKYGYYDIWFEGLASKNGLKMYNKNRGILRYE